MIICSKCPKQFSYDIRGYTEEAILWLLRAHHWEQHGGKPPEGLGNDGH